MSHRYTNRRWPPDYRGELYGAKRRLRELRAERRTIAARLTDLEGANAALIAEVNRLRAELRTARAINVAQARLLVEQDAPAWVAPAVAAIIARKDTDPCP